MKVYVYKVFEDGVELFEGTGDEIAKKFGINRGSISYLERHGLLGKKKYKLVHTGIRDVEKTWHNKNNIRRVKKEEPYVYDPYRYLTEHLKIYGNTWLKEDPALYEDRLKNDGIKITYYQEKNRDYIVERVYD